MWYVGSILMLSLFLIFLTWVVGKLEKNYDHPKVIAYFELMDAIFGRIRIPQRVKEGIVMVLFILLLVAAFMESVPSNNPYP